MSLWSRAGSLLREMLTLPDYAGEMIGRQSARIKRQAAEITSLRASLDDANATISRFSAAMRARDKVIHEATMVLQRLHRQEAGK